MNNVIVSLHSTACKCKCFSLDVSITGFIYLSSIHRSIDILTITHVNITFTFVLLKKKTAIIHFMLFTSLIKNMAILI